MVAFLQLGITPAQTNDLTVDEFDVIVAHIDSQRER